jgi:hypothetical protein
MYNLLISFLAGCIACGAYWADHMMVRTDEDILDTSMLWKCFIVGTFISYITIQFTVPVADAISTINIEDTLKTGQPTF